MADINHHVNDPFIQNPKVVIPKKISIIFPLNTKVKAQYHTTATGIKVGKILNTLFL